MDGRGALPLVLLAGCTACRNCVADGLAGSHVFTRSPDGVGYVQWFRRGVGGSGGAPVALSMPGVAANVVFVPLSDAVPPAPGITLAVGS